ncbi:MAG: tripartite tricarboxylate transporter substrate binding protein [Betaproteobacteria bacterium]
MIKPVCRLFCAMLYAPVSLMFGVVLLIVANMAMAQNYPNKTIRIVVPYSPGTGYDSIARIVSPVLSQRLGQAVVIENIPGASSTIGAGVVARASPDGYTLLMIGEGTMASGHLYKKLPFNPLTDFAPITLTGRGTLVLMTHSRSGIRSVVELIAKAKTQPGLLTYSSPGVGTSQSLKMALIEESAGIKMVHVPYKSSAGALNDLVAGIVTAGLVPVHQGMTYVNSGNLVPLAVISPKRSASAPEVPTLRESGIPNVDADMWYAFVAPKNTPPNIVATLNLELRRIISLPDIKMGLERIGLEVVTSTPIELQNIMQQESDTAAMTITKNNIVLD